MNFNSRIKNLLITILIALNCTLYANSIKDDNSFSHNNSKLLNLTAQEKDYLKKHPNITVAFSSIFEPLMIKNTDSTFEGIVPDIFKEFNKKITSTFNIVDGNWVDLIKNVANNKFDMMGMMSSKVAKEKNMLVVDFPFEFIPTAFAKKERDFNLYDYEDIKKLRITYPKNVLFIASYMEEHFKDSKLIPADNAKEAFDKLLNKEADISINMSFDAYILKKTNNTHIEPIFSMDEINNPISIAIKPEAKELQSIMQKLMNNSDRSQMLDIVEKWSLSFLTANNKTIEFKKDNTVLYIVIGVTIFLVVVIIILGIIKNKQIEKEIHTKKTSLRFHNFILLLTVCLIFTLGYVINLFIQEEKNTAYIINISGKQRMLSQRTMLFAKEYSKTKQLGELAIYKNLLKTMSKDNSILTTFAKDNYSQDYYYKKPNLNKLVKDYINLHYKYIDTNDDKLLDTLFNNSKTILVQLDRAVKLHEEYSKIRINEIKTFLFLIFILLIAIIIFELIYVFKPTLNILEQTLKQLEKEKQNADRANAAKSEFLANMSHEIRTPLNGIIGLNEMLMETQLNHLQKDYLKKAKQSSVALLNVINDILDYSKIEAGKLDIVETSFNIHKMLTTINDLFGYQIAEKGLEFSFIIDPKIPIELIGDNLRITQVLDNYLGNAVKFTKNGYILILVKLKNKLDENTILIDFEVKDSGIGISKENQSKLFKAFSQADNSTTRTYGGTGLGLTISKQLVELMKGEIWFESIKGEGSSFGCTLPLKINKDKKLDLEMQNFKNKKYLIVEDNEIEKEYLEQILKSWGINTSSASNGMEAFELLQTTYFDYILLDWEMPVLDGIGLLKKLKQEKIFIPNILMVTAYIKKGLLEKAKQYELKIDKVLQKPYTPSNLYEIIFDTELSQNQEKEVENILKESKNALLVEDNEVNQLVSTKTLEKLKFKVELAKDGFEAVEKSKNNIYDIIFMDLQMPNMDGFEAAKKIREFNTQIPIIALSAAVMKKDKELTKESGMNEHISKPLIKKDLYKVLKKYFELELIYKNQEEKNIYSLPTIKGIDIQALQNELNIDEQSLFKMYHNFKVQTLNTIETLEKDANSEEIQRFIHKLKSSSGNLNIKNIAQLSEKIYSSKEYLKEDIIELKKLLLRCCEDIETYISPKILETNIDYKKDFIDFTKELIDLNINFKFVNQIKKDLYIKIAKKSSIDETLLNNLEKAFNENDQFKSAEILKQILTKEIQ